MFKIPNTIPSKTSEPWVLADFVEYICLKRGNNFVSIHDALKSIIAGADETKVDGIEDESDDFVNIIEDVLKELDRRTQHTQGRYPFLIKGNALILNEQNAGYWPYVYMLLCTRFNMTKNKVKGNLDGTLLFEKFCCEIAQSYLGHRSEVFLFGTRSGNGFKKNIRLLTQKLGEGRGYINRDNVPPSAQDDKLDLVAWKNFSDKRVSKLIVFGQCKTGTSWQDMLNQLQPNVFCKKWFKDMPVETPTRLFFIADIFYQNQWHTKAYEAGVIFDRFRIMDYLPDKLSNGTNKDIIKWTKQAIKDLN